MGLIILNPRFIIHLVHVIGVSRNYNKPKPFSKRGTLPPPPHPYLAHVLEYSLPLTIKYTYSQWSTSPRLDEPTVRERSARSTPPTRLPSTRRERTLWPHRERGDMTVSHDPSDSDERCGVIVRTGMNDSEGCRCERWRMKRARCMGSERSMIKGAVVYRNKKRIDGGLAGGYPRRRGTYHREQY
jgi:hypothetical protein